MTQPMQLRTFGLDNNIVMTYSEAPQTLAEANPAILDAFKARTREYNALATELTCMTCDRRKKATIEKMQGLYELMVALRTIAA